MSLLILAKPAELVAGSGDFAVGGIPTQNPQKQASG
jgi:hypothetical protein